MHFIIKSKNINVKKREIGQTCACIISGTCCPAKWDVNEMNAHCDRVFIIWERDRGLYNKKLK
mgnify:CR=1 FL=1